ncbi:MAG TPA: Mur ligase family protein, partial [Pseudomonadota bacterium]|nr:Mur ligase family protein [Pseudomonadota bacterium]
MASAGYTAALRDLCQLALYGIQPGTERLAAVLSRLGEPQAGIPAIHIAGTNGKGSTAAYCASLLGQLAGALRQAGGRRLRIGLYTSPHLQRVRERIQPSDEAAAGFRDCTEDEFVGALSAVQAAAQAAPAVTLTFFEALTAAAFVLWREAGVDLAVVETGLGGRLDATRLCAAQVTVVTSIGLDHVELLGPTRADIAREKAGIFRPGIPALAACSPPDARAVLIAEAQRIGAPLRLYAPEPSEPAAPSRVTELGAIPPLDGELAAAVPLSGEHQLSNAALAVTAVQLFVRPGSGLQLAPGVELAPGSERPTSALPS